MRLGRDWMSSFLVGSVAVFSTTAFFERLGGLEGLPSACCAPFLLESLGLGAVDEVPAAFSNGRLGKSDVVLVSSVLLTTSVS